VTSTPELDVPRINVDDLFEGLFKVFLTLGTLGIVYHLGTDTTEGRSYVHQVHLATLDRLDTRTSVSVQCIGVDVG
jgi:hypothetical protein